MPTISPYSMYFSVINRAVKPGFSANPTLAIPTQIDYCSLCLCLIEGENSPESLKPRAVRNYKQALTEAETAGIQTILELKTPGLSFASPRDPYLYLSWIYSNFFAGYKIPEKVVDNFYSQFINNKKIYGATDDHLIPISQLRTHQELQEYPKLPQYLMRVCASCNSKERGNMDLVQFLEGGLSNNNVFLNSLAGQFLKSVLEYDPGWNPQYTDKTLIQAFRSSAFRERILRDIVYGQTICIPHPSESGKFIAVSRSFVVLDTFCRWHFDCKSQNLVLLDDTGRRRKARDLIILLLRFQNNPVHPMYSPEFKELLTQLRTNCPSLAPTIAGIEYGIDISYHRLLKRLPMILKGLRNACKPYKKSLFLNRQPTKERERQLDSFFVQSLRISLKIMKEAQQKCPPNHRLHQVCLLKENIYLFVYQSAEVPNRYQVLSRSHTKGTVSYNTIDGYLPEDEGEHPMFKGCPILGRRSPITR